MKVMIETFITVVFLSLIVVIGGQVIGAQISVNNATTFHSSAVQVMEESNFDETVIEEVIASASENGYELTVEVDQVSLIQCSNCNSQWELGGPVTCSHCGSTNVVTNYLTHDGVVTLNYDVDIALLNIHESGSITSYAR